MQNAKSRWSAHALTATTATLAVLSAACNDDANPTAARRGFPARPALAASSAAQGRNGGTLDDEFIDLARQIPGFGGYLQDERGRLTVALVDTSQRAAAAGVLAPILSARRLSVAGMVVRRVLYDFGQLGAWKNSARALIGVPGVVSLDADEARNRVVVGIKDESARAAAAARLAQLGVPAAATIIEVESGYTMGTTLSDSPRPVAGGFQVNIPAYNQACSLGFTVRRPNTAKVYFLTNSHCTVGTGFMSGYNNSGATFTQPNGALLGSVVDDRPLFACSQGSRGCRRSDAALIEYADPNSANIGQIARTVSPGVSSGSKDVVGYFSIISTGANGNVGSRIEKVGFRTGWTGGTIEYSCKDAIFADGSALLCQQFVNAGWNHGDSGSPAFQQSSGSDAFIAGLVWGGQTDLKRFGYSSTDYIQSELGTLFARRSDAGSLLGNAYPMQLVSGLGPDRCMGVTGGSRATGAQLEISTCGGAPQQVFFGQSDSKLHVYEDGDVKCVAIGGAGNDGDPIVIAPCDGSDAQSWIQMSYNGPLINWAYWGQCIAVAGGGTGDGTPLVLAPCYGAGVEQNWIPTAL